MTVPGSDQAVYISDDVVLSNNDVVSSRVIPGEAGPQVEIVFTEAGAEKFAAVTKKNIMKPLAILVGGQLISAPIVRDQINGGKVKIAGFLSEQEARRIADGIAGR